MAEDYSDKKLERILKKAKKWYSLFEKSKHFKRLTRVQKNEAYSIVEAFTGLMYSYNLLTPGRWNVEDTKDCCLYLMPRKLTKGDSYFRSVAPVLSAFFTFLGEEGLLTRGPELAEAVKGLGMTIMKNASDPKYWGMSKTIFMPAVMSGIDMTNEEEIQRYLEEKYGAEHVVNLSDKSRKPKNLSKGQNGGDN